MHIDRRRSAPHIVVASSGLFTALTGAPWWVALAVCCYGVLGLLLTLVEAVFPQESADRLAWWRDRRRHRERLRIATRDSAKLRGMPPNRR